MTTHTNDPTIQEIPSTGAKIELVDLSECEREIILELSAEQVTKEFESVYRKLARTVELPGFRPGKAPVSVVKQRFHREARSEVLNQLANRAVMDATRRYQIRPAAEPEVIEANLREGAPCKLRVRLDVFPNVEVKNYKGLRATKKIVAVTPKDVEAVIRRLQEAQAVLVPTERTRAEPGDVVTLKASAETLAEDAPTASVIFQNRELQVELDPDQLDREFYENLVGMTLGETRSFIMSHGEDFPVRELAGRRARHTVQLMEIHLKDLPLVDDEFARSVDSQVSTLAELREKIRQTLEESRERKAEENLRQDLLAQLLDRHRFPLPRLLLRQRALRRAEEMAQFLWEKGLWKETSEATQSKILELGYELAERDLRSALVLEKIADLEGITVSDQEVDLEIARRAARMHQSAAELKHRLTKGGLLDSIKTELRNRMALETVVANAQVTTEIVEASEENAQA
jgi:trigger factor